MITKEIENNPFIMDVINDDTISDSFDVNYTGFTYGDIVCTNSMYNDLIRRFGSYEKAKEFYFFAKSMINDGQFEKCGTESVPYLDFNIYLEQDVYDEGVMTPYIEFWVAGKKYYIGDVVYYSSDGTTDNIKCYKLKYNENAEWGVDEIEISKEYYDSLPNDRKKVIDGKYYLIQYYYCGYYNEDDRVIYFDNNLHWVEALDNDDITYSEEQYETLHIVENMLGDLKRKKNDVDDDGIVLPFNLHYTNVIDAEGHVINRILDKSICELPYICGYMNLSITANEEIVGDVLNSITLYNSDDDSISELIFNTSDIPILSNQIDFDKYNAIKFDYYKNCILDNINNKWVRRDKSGINYFVIYALRKENYIGNVNGEEVNIDYPVFNYNITLDEITKNISGVTFDNEDLDDMKDIAIINYTQEQIVADNFYNIPYFKDESNLGLQNYNQGIDADIERGTSAAFERHNILGEVCTLSDLENYRNNYFKL